MKSYQHSKTFDIIKNIKEGITGNFTSLQYLSTLDFFLWNALRPIATECPSLFYNYLAKVVARQTLKSSAKFTSGERQNLPIQFFNVLVAQDETKAFEQAKLLYINRGILFGFLSFFRRQLKYYMELHQGLHKLRAPELTTLFHRIESSLGLRHQGKLYAAMVELTYWDDRARAFKERIVEKYVRMAVLQAQRTYKDYNHFVPLDDVVQIYLLVVSKSIDRCDARQGVLTTFIQNWFKSARSEVARLAESQTHQSYESLIEDCGDLAHEVIGTTQPDRSSETQQHLAYVAKQVDPQGLVRISLSIPEFVPRSYLAILDTFALD